MSLGNTTTRALITLVSCILVIGVVHRVYERVTAKGAFSKAAKFISHEKDSFIVFSLLNLLYSLGQVELLHKHVENKQPMSYFTALVIVWAFPFTYLGAMFDSLVVLKTCSPDFATTRRIITLKRKNEAVFQARESLKYGSMVFATVTAMMFHALVLQQGQEKVKVVKEVYHLYSILCHLLVAAILAVYTHVNAWRGMQSVENTLSD